MKVLLLFTGGTISMVRDAETGALHPADMQTFKAFVPELYEVYLKQNHSYYLNSSILITHPNNLHLMP